MAGMQVRFAICMLVCNLSWCSRLELLLLVMSLAG